MYGTISTVDGFPEYAAHATLAEAEAFAENVAREGAPCRVMLLMREYMAEETLPQPMNRVYATGPGPHKEAHGW